ncbi:unnamed protein product [Trichogramma brassicae]|uniref:Uncharacterized protein n=1 Tax=Trichogramma brassicae TaxID=86971 RepID=A0A6H5HY41_9HYME|nr:unnamed protein product [Trichogramma brassicae]
MVERMHRTPQSGPEVPRPRHTVDSRTSRRPPTPPPPPRPTNYLQRGPASVASGDGFRHVATHTREFVARQEPTKRRRQSSFSALRRLFQAIRPVPASRHVHASRPFVFKDLATERLRVFRRLDKTILKPLEQPYTRTTQSHPPHQRAKLCRRRNGVAKTLSNRSLKPAYLDVADSGASQATTPEQPTTTQPSSTRRVTFSLPAQTAQSH